MTVLRFRVVGEVGRCAFCLRVLPREDLGEAADDTLVCRNKTDCCGEVERQEKLGWKDHPAFRRSA